MAWPLMEAQLLIIGGGINGAGIARDAALRGLKTVLLEQGDFCGGATSWSTRLIHGGLRYLEFFEFGLVRESLREREFLLHTAPHLVKPLQLTIPIYGDRSRPYWKIQAGMTLYDLLSYDKTLPNHQMLNQGDCLTALPELQADSLNGAAQYYDAQVAYAERLALENILDAEAAGAIVKNYVEVIALERDVDRIVAVTCRDRIKNATFTIPIAPECLIVNTSGPWVDQVLQRGMRESQSVPIGQIPKIGPTKGSHIVVDRFPGLPETGGFYVEARSDGRPFFIIPWLGYVLIGTTDLRYSDSLDYIKASDAEIDYLIHETNQIIPAANLTRNAIRFTYSGVRPLPASTDQTTASITRSHLLFNHKDEGARNLISLIGGKITTYRQVAEEVVDMTYRYLQQSPPPCITAQRVLPGAANFQPKVDLPATTIDYLQNLYGARASGIFELVETYPDLAQPLFDNHPSIAAQIVFAARSEYAQTLVDILHRRTLLSIHGDYGFNLLPIASSLLQQYCQWSQERCDRAVEDYRRYMCQNCIPDYQLKNFTSAS